MTKSPHKKWFNSAVMTSLHTRNGSTQQICSTENLFKVSINVRSFNSLIKVGVW